MTSLETLMGSMTVAELARVGGITVEHVVRAAMGGVSPSSRGAPKENRGRVASPAVPRGGIRLDHVLAALADRGGPAKLEDIRAKTGGSVPQVRAALKKLAAAGSVRISGERRGTRYESR